MKQADRILGILLALLGFLCLAEAVRVWDGIGGTGFMPLFLGVVFALLSLGLLASPSQPPKSSPLPWPAKEVWQRIGLIFTVLGLYILLLPWFGYLLATTIFLTALVWVMGRVRWGYCLIFGVGVSAVTHVVFKTWLNMPFPSGIFLPFG
jgi:putative tricarboxylic transport membrane protein